MYQGSHNPRSICACVCVGGESRRVRACVCSLCVVASTVGQPTLKGCGCLLQTAGFLAPGSPGGFLCTQEKVSIILDRLQHSYESCVVFAWQSVVRFQYYVLGCTVLPLVWGSACCTGRLGLPFLHLPVLGLCASTEGRVVCTVAGAPRVCTVEASLGVCACACACCSRCLQWPNFQHGVMLFPEGPRLGWCAQSAKKPTRVQDAPPGGVCALLQQRGARGGQVWTCLRAWRRRTHRVCPAHLVSALAMLAFVGCACVPVREKGFALPAVGRQRTAVAADCNLLACWSEQRVLGCPEPHLLKPPQATRVGPGQGV